MSRKTASSNALRTAADYLVTCLCVTAIAQIGCMPLIIYYFNIFTPAGLIANLLIVPVVAPVIVIGFAAAALGAVSLQLSLPLDWMLKLACGYILGVVRLCSGPQVGLTSFGSPPVWIIVLYYAALWGLFGWLRVRSIKRKIEG